MGEGPLILVIDDEAQIRRMIAISLEAHGYIVKGQATASDGLQFIESNHPDLVILDLGLPDMDGFDALKKLREWNDVPVIILSIRSTEEEKVLLLDAGANDYLTKPFGMGELLARIRAALRFRTSADLDGIFRTGNVSFDFTKHILMVDDVEVKLTPTEFAILRYLALNAGKIVTHAQLIRELWGPNAIPDESYLRVYILQLRRKIEKNPSLPELIVTEQGLGYRLTMPTV